MEGVSLVTDNKPLLGLLGQAGRVRKKQQEMKQKHDQHARSRTLYGGDPVWAKHHLEEPRWLGGVIESRLGPLSYEIILMDGRVMRRHQDDVILRETGSKAQEKLNKPQFPCPPPMPLPNVSATTYMDPHTESRNHEEKSSEEGLYFSRTTHRFEKSGRQILRGCAAFSKTTEYKPAYWLAQIHSPSQTNCWIYKGTHAKTEIIVKLSSCVLGYVTI